jgi:hypothetical protein
MPLDDFRQSTPVDDSYQSAPVDDPGGRLMSANIAAEMPTLAVGETNNFAVSFANVLDSGELLTGTPTVADEGSATDLTISNVTVNSAALTINGLSVAAGEAVQFKVRGQSVAKSPYTLKITVTTDSSPAQTKVRAIRFNVEAV